MKTIIIYNRRGITLIEISIAMLLFVIVLGGITYTFMVEPTNRTIHINYLTNDIYKTSYILKKDLLSSIDITTPALPTSNTSVGPVNSLEITVSDNTTSTGRAYVKYQSSTNMLERCKSASLPCTSFDDIFTTWEGGYIGLTGTGLQVWRGIDVDGNGLLSNREKNLIRIKMSIGQFEGPPGATQLISSKTLVMEVLVDGRTPI